MKTLAEIGKELNVSAERVRQIQEQALRKMHAELRRRGLSFSDLVDEDYHPQLTEHLGFVEAMDHGNSL